MKDLKALVINWEEQFSDLEYAIAFTKDVLAEYKSLDAECERLTSENATLKAALGPFLEDCTEEAMEDWEGASDDEYVDLTVKIGAVRRAVRLVNEERSDDDSQHGTAVA